MAGHARTPTKGRSGALEPAPLGHGPHRLSSDPIVSLHFAMIHLLDGRYEVKVYFPIFYVELRNVQALRDKVLC